MGGMPPTKIITMGQKSPSKNKKGMNNMSEVKKKVESKKASQKTKGSFNI